MKPNNKTIVVDVDNTLCFSPATPGDYANATPIDSMIERLRVFQEEGFYITLFSSRQMRTYEGNLGLINANTLPTMINWLNQHNVPYDEIYLGKPWCGKEGFYVDDRAIRPKEFLTMSNLEIQRMLQEESEELEQNHYAGAKL